jgi:hypothetical protein
MTIRAPSAIALKTAFNIPGKEAAIIRSLIKLNKRPKDYTGLFPRTREWIDSCYHRPSKGEVNLFAINELIGGHGVEAIFKDGEVWPALEFINMGDTYVPTLCRVNGNYFIADLEVATKRAGV